MADKYDCVIVGTGPVGYSAAIYAHRLGLKTVVVGETPGGTLTLTHLVENYPGFASISGPDLMEKMEAHVKYFNIPIREELIVDIEKRDKGFWLKSDEREYEAHTVIWATGATHRRLNVPGEPEFMNKGVSYCATCDAAFFKGKVVAMVGSGDSAVKEALLLTEYASKVHMLVRKDKLHPEPINMARLEAKIKEGMVEVHPNTQVVGVKGGKVLTHAVLNREINGSKEFPIQGLFVEIGAIPNSKLVKDKLGVKTNGKGYIILKRGNVGASASNTNVVAFYAAGDVADLDWKQAITGVSEGVLAAYGAYMHIKNEAVETI